MFIAICILILVLISLGFLFGSVYLRYANYKSAWEKKQALMKERADMFKQIEDIIQKSNPSAWQALQAKLSKERPGDTEVRKEERLEAAVEGLLATVDNEAVEPLHKRWISTEKSYILSLKEWHKARFTFEETQANFPTNVACRWLQFDTFDAEEEETSNS